jgi:glycosyltransferase involved in cell wall biosynthesis
MILTRPKVTIGVCVKNNAPTISETIRSIFEQDFPRELMELIIVDGYSEDGTLSIIKNHLKNSEIRFKIFREREGLGRARQIVVDNAEGEYIVWVDGDMVLSKNYVDELVKYMDQHFDVCIAKGKPSLNFISNLLGTLEAYSRAIGKIVHFSSDRAKHSGVLGTSGAIYRSKVIKAVGGFDKYIRGYCEDWDVELKVKDAGWSLKLFDAAEYMDYERCGITLKSLWNRYWKRGYDTYYFIHKNKNRRLIKHYRMFPPAAFVLGILHSQKLFKLTHKKEVFLLPLQYVFKMTAWYFGYITSHLNFYEPKCNKHFSEMRCQVVT